MGPQQISTIVFTYADTIRLATAAALGGRRLGRAFDTHPFDCRQISGDRQPRPGCDYRRVARERTRVAEEALDAANTVYKLRALLAPPAAQGARVCMCMRAE